MMMMVDTELPNPIMVDMEPTKEMITGGAKQHPTAMPVTRTIYRLDSWEGQGNESIMKNLF